MDVSGTFFGEKLIKRGRDKAGNVIRKVEFADGAAADAFFEKAEKASVEVYHRGHFDRWGYLCVGDGWAVAYLQASAPLWGPLPADLKFKTNVAFFKTERRRDNAVWRERRRACHRGWNERPCRWVKFREKALTLEQLVDTDTIDGEGPLAFFALDPRGVEYLVEWVDDPSEINDQNRCNVEGVKVTLHEPTKEWLCAERYLARL